MIKVMVVVYGLVLFVPQNVELDHEGVPVADRMTVLFVDASTMGPDMGHQPTMWRVAQGGDLDGPIPIPAGFAMVASQGAADTRVELQARWRFPQLGTLNPGVETRKDCLENKFSCGTSQGDFVLGTAELTGSWTTRHASVCDNTFPLPVIFNDPATFSYRRTENGPRRHDAPPFKLATALVLEAELNSLEGLLTIQRDDQPPQPIQAIELSGADCTKWIVGTTQADKCAVIVLGNPPKQPKRCGKTICPFHHHFNVFYDLMSGVDHRSRWLPYVEENAECPSFQASLEMRSEAGADEARGPESDPPTPPAVRCPPAFADGPDT